jgi:hypothetical protein
MAIALAVVGTALSAYGAYENGRARSNAAHYNADVAGRDAEIAIDQGNADAGIQARSASMQIGAAKAQYGASGVDVNSGSPLDVLQASATRATLDNLRIKYNARVKAYGLGNEQTAYNYQADAAHRAGNIGAASAILSGSSQAYGMYYNPRSTAGTEMDV